MRLKGRHRRGSAPMVVILVQTNVAPNAFRTSTIIPQYMTKFAMDQVDDQPGLNVSITV